MSKDPSDIIINNNEDMKIETVKFDTPTRSNTKATLFYNNEREAIQDNNKKVVCEICTKDFFTMFFRNNTNLEISDLADSDDPFLKTIAGSRIYMDYDVKQKIYRCRKKPQEHYHVPALNPTQIKDRRKTLVPAGISNYPENLQFMQDTSQINNDTFVTANTSKNLSKKKKVNNVFDAMTDKEIINMFPEIENTETITYDAIEQNDSFT